MWRTALTLSAIITTLACFELDDAHNSPGDVSVDENYVTKIAPDYDNLASTPSPKRRNEKDKWLIYVSAGPTVFIFIICVIAISVKNCSEGESKSEGGRSVLNPANATAAAISRIKAKPKVNNGVYDKMLEDFKDDKHKGNKAYAYIGRKYSQIKIDGQSGSPKSLARKHLNIIGEMSGRPSFDDEDENPIKTLVAKSTPTFIGGALLQDIGKNESKDTDCTEDSFDINNTVKEILRRSVENLTVADRRTFCDELDEILLPEDLADAFNNFDYWQESDI